MAGEFFESSWGSIRLFCTEITTDGSRTKVVHDLTGGDVHPVQDRGRRSRRTKVKLAFDDFPGFPPPIEAARSLEDAVASGASAIFSHPMLGSFMAGVGDFEQHIDESGIITADCEFIPEDAVPPISPAGAGATGVSGEQAVSAAADELDTQTAQVMTDEEIRDILTDESGVTISEDARVSVTSWGQIGNIDRDELLATTRLADINKKIAAAQASSIRIRQALENAKTLAEKALRDLQGSAARAKSAALSFKANPEVEASNRVRLVLIDTARLSDRISAMIEDGGLEDDVALWPSYRAAIMLGEAVRSAAIAATSEVPSTFVMRIVEPTALLPLAARVYGGAAASERARQILALNDISTPAWIAPGDYLFPAKTLAQRASF